MNNEQTTTQQQIARLHELLDAQHARILQAYQDAKACADILRMNEVMQQVLDQLDDTRNEAFYAMLATEHVLRQVWDTPEEDEAWSHL